MNQHDNYDSPWTLLGSVIGLLVLARLGAGLLVGLAHGGLLALLVLAALLYAGIHVVRGPDALPLGSGVWSRLRGAPRPLGGEARWATLLDLWRAGWLGREGWPIGVYRACWGLLRVIVRIPTQDQTQGCYLVAPTGKGKSASIIIPVVLSATRVTAPQRRQSYVVLDPKTEILRRCQEVAQLERTHTVLVWNPTCPERSTIAFDPLASVPPVDDPRHQEAIETVANIFLAATADSPIAVASGVTMDPFWPKMVSAVFKACLQYLRGYRPDLSMLDVATYLAEATPEDMVRHLTTRPRTGAALLRGRVLHEMLFNERVRGAVVADLADRAVILTDPRLERIMRPGPLPLFDLDQFIADPSLLFLQVGGLGDPLTPLLSVMVATIQTQIARRAVDGPLPRGLRFVLDEAGVVGRIHHLEHGTALLRGANVGYLITVQDRAQLETNYGASRARTIQDNLAHRLVLGGVSDEDARWCAESIGQRAAYRDLPGQGPGGRASRHYVKEEWPLLRPDQLRRLRYKVVVDSSAIPPALLRLRHYKERR